MCGIFAGGHYNQAPFPPFGYDREVLPRRANPHVVVDAAPTAEHAPSRDGGPTNRRGTDAEIEKRNHARCGTAQDLRGPPDPQGSHEARQNVAGSRK